MIEKVKKRRRGHTRLSGKHQVTIPVEILRTTGIQPGEELRVEPDGWGRIVLTRVIDPIEEFAGTIEYPAGYLEELRSEWE
jgi:bifunctional DNA-binding transcriptional regulator/antitoxin component of YhaV-PrlF toxin-antitoxin module